MELRTQKVTRNMVKVQKEMNQNVAINSTAENRNVKRARYKFCHLTFSPNCAHDGFVKFLIFVCIITKQIHVQSKFEQFIKVTSFMD